MKWISKDFLYQSIVRKHLSLVGVGFILGSLVYSYLHFSGFQNLFELFLSGLLGVSVVYVTQLSNSPLNHYIPWKEQTGLRLLTGILLHVFAAVLLVFFSLWGYGLLFKKPSLFSSESQDVLLKIVLLLFCISLIYNIIYFATYSYYHYAKGQFLELQAQRKQTHLQLTALKSQLSPHFLFNSMNTLSSLFLRDINKAETFIRSLASSYQYTLKTYEDPLVTIKEELSFVTSYCYLIKTRFGDHLTVDIKLPSHILQSKIPPLTLQMLVENAVKHNIVDSSRPLRVQITSDGNTLSICNNKTAKRPKTDSLKIGLSNITSRYKLLTNKSVEVINTRDFTVQLPLII